MIDAHSTARLDSLETVARPLRVHWGAGPRACALRATVMPRTSSGEHKFKLARLMVSRVSELKPNRSRTETESESLAGGGGLQLQIRGALE